MTDVTERWSRRLRDFVPGFMLGLPALAQYAGRATVLLHGSTAMGIDDPHSDLDLWLLLPQDDFDRFAGQTEERFFGFQLDGKEGHLNAESADAFRERLAGCHMDTIYQLRSALPIVDETAIADRLVAAAQGPMREEVSRAFFFYHYVEMRGEHRACDTPIERRQPVALLLALAKTITHGLQASIVLHGEPYPYDKWLLEAARETPTGAVVAEQVEGILSALGNDALHVPGPERGHPMGLRLRRIRQVLIDGAHVAGIKEPWLHQWWLHMNQAREAIEGLRW
jgi:hypothetical protein